MDKETSKLMDSECLKDYKSRHRFDKLGVIFDTTKLKNRAYLVWRCLQCEKCIAEELEFLDAKNSKEVKP